MSDTALPFSPDVPRHASLRMIGRFAVAGLVVAATVFSSACVMVSAGQAVVITRFGAPVRVDTVPGLAWKLPAPLETATTVDLKLHTTSGGLQDVGTREGLRILIQAFVAWSVPAEPEAVRRYLRAGGNSPDEVARQLRSLLGSSLQVVASDFALPELVNTDSSKVKLAAFEHHLMEIVAPQAKAIYGIDVTQLGVERLSLPAETLAATVARMRAERETVAAAHTADGLRQAAAVRSNAARDARIIVARAREEAATTEAKAHEQAAAAYAESYRLDPQLYENLRTLDTLGAVVNRNTRIIVRTDTPPFDALVNAPSLTKQPDVSSAIQNLAGH